MTLRELNTGESAVITKVGGEGALRQHLLDMGVIPGAGLKVVKFAPMGDPMEILIHGYSLTLRIHDAAAIEVEPAEAESGDIQPRRRDKALHTTHPGLGETGKYHSKEHANPLPAGTTLTFALAGNQNCGKTTLFNRLTGSNQHVGNFPGVTVDRKDGPILGLKNTVVTDLPGIYSLSPYTAEEIVSRRHILEEKPAAIINIVDAGHLERNLYLTIQLLELGLPMVLALNMMDEVTANGGSIDVNQMESMLGIPVVAISASKNEGINELVEHAIHIAKYQERPARQDFCSKNEYGGAVHRCLHSIMHLVEDHAENADLPIRFAANKLIEGDPHVTEDLRLTENEKETVEHIIRQMEQERGLDRSAAMADTRYSFIRKVCSECVVKPVESREQRRSRQVDKILTGRYTAIPTFILLMSALFWLTFGVVGAWLQDLLQNEIDLLSATTATAMESACVHPTLRSLVTDGIFSGLGSVVSFVPVIIVLFFFLSMLEDSGYMARVAFVSDKLLRKIGLSGRSIVPMLIGFGCTVPGVMATRTLPSARDRRITILLTPFMSCSAKIAIYGFIINSLFPEHTGIIMVGLYLLSILIGVLLALANRYLVNKSDPSPFVMELPPYRLPNARNVGLLLWDKTRDFLERAFTVIFIGVLVIWVLQTFDFRLRTVTESSESMLALMAGLLTPLFEPAGLGDWRIITALISGFMAKESVVSTLSVLYGSAAAVGAALTPAAGAALLVFSLLYTPCIAAIAAIKRELNLCWTLFIVVFQCLVAWTAAVAAYHMMLSLQIMT